MNSKKLLLIVAMSFTFFNAFAQIPDTLIINTIKVKGYGPFIRMNMVVQAMDSTNGWFKAIPAIKGIPNNLKKLMVCSEEVDFLQHTYQSYYAGKITKEQFKSFKAAHNWEPDSTEYTKDAIKVSIPLAAGYDEKGRLNVIIDRNNNYDLSDDVPYIIPEKIKDQPDWKRYNDSLLICARYEFYYNHQIREDSCWIYVDYSSDILPGPRSSGSGTRLNFGFAEYHLGEFMLDGIKYYIALHDLRPVMNDFYHILIGEADKGITPMKYIDEMGPGKGELVKIGKYDYRFIKASLDGSRIILVKESAINNNEGNQEGFKAFNFEAKTIERRELNLQSFRGKYVLLDFWGTWCIPCRSEIKTLKRIYKIHKDKNFVMIGIAKDKEEILRSFIAKEKIEWPQIVQDGDSGILNLYNIQAFPTTYLIDPEGKIIAKNLIGTALENKLDEIFEK